VSPSALNFPSPVSIRTAGLPQQLRSVEEALKMIEGLPSEISRLPRWTFAKALLTEALRSQKSRDLKIAQRQLVQAVSNEKWQ
jgi:hypothetical protein